MHIELLAILFYFILFNLTWLDFIGCELIWFKFVSDKWIDWTIACREWQCACVGGCLVDGSVLTQNEILLAVMRMDSSWHNPHRVCDRN